MFNKGPSIGAGLQTVHTVRSFCCEAYRFIRGLRISLPRQDSRIIQACSYIVAIASYFFPLQRGHRDHGIPVARTCQRHMAIYCPGMEVGFSSSQSETMADCQRRLGRACLCVAFLRHSSSRCGTTIASTNSQYHCRTIQKKREAATAATACATTGCSLL